MSALLRVLLLLLLLLLMMMMMMMLTMMRLPFVYFRSGLLQMLKRARVFIPHTSQALRNEQGPQCHTPRPHRRVQRRNFLFDRGNQPRSRAAGTPPTPNTTTAFVY
jgi:hypothetical protein